MTDVQAADTSRLEVAAALLASSVIGAPLVIAAAVQTILSAINPRGIDVSHPAAYEFEIGAALALSALGAIVAVSLVLARLRARAASRAVMRVPYMILVLQVAFAVVAFTLFLFSGA